MTQLIVEEYDGTKWCFFRKLNPMELQTILHSNTGDYYWLRLWGNIEQFLNLGETGAFWYIASKKDVKGAPKLTKEINVPILAQVSRVDDNEIYYGLEKEFNVEMRKEKLRKIENI